MYIVLAGLFLVLFLDRRRPWSLANLDRVLLLAWLPAELAWWWNLRVGMLLYYLPLLYFFLRLLWIARGGPAVWHPPYQNSLLLGLLALLLLYRVALPFTAPVADSGRWAAIGARWVVEHGTPPYGHFSGGDTYGPFLYVMVVPFAALSPLNANGEPLLAARLVALLLDLATIAGLLALGQTQPLNPPRPHGGVGGGAPLRRSWGKDGWVHPGWVAGVALAVAYVTLPYSGSRSASSNLAQLAGAAVSVWAVARVGRPWLSGAFLGLAASAVFYPAFLLPLWAGYYQGRQRWLFLAAALLAVLLGSVVVFFQADGLRLFLEKTLLYQEVAPTWSTWSVWGQFPEVRWLQRPLGVAYLAFVLMLFFWPWRGRREPGRLLALSAAVVLGTQLWKSHMGGYYIGWWLVFLLPVLLGRLPGAAQAEEPGQPDDAPLPKTDQGGAEQ